MGFFKDIVNETKKAVKKGSENIKTKSSDNKKETGKKKAKKGFFASLHLGRVGDIKEVTGDFDVKNAKVELKEEGLIIFIGGGVFSKSEISYDLNKDLKSWGSVPHEKKGTSAGKSLLALAGAGMAMSARRGGTAAGLGFSRGLANIDTSKKIPFYIVTLQFKDNKILKGEMTSKECDKLKKEMSVNNFKKYENDCKKLINDLTKSISDTQNKFETLSDEEKEKVPSTIESMKKRIEDIPGEVEEIKKIAEKRGLI